MFGVGGAFPSLRLAGTTAVVTGVVTAAEAGTAKTFLGTLVPKVTGVTTRGDGTTPGVGPEAEVTFPFALAPMLEGDPMPFGPVIPVTELGAADKFPFTLAPPLV